MADELTQSPLGVVRSPQHRTVFANVFSFRVNANDIAITFSMQDNLPIPTPQGMQMALVNQEEMTVAMTLAGLKALTQHLTMVVESAEKIIGPIRITEKSKPTDAQRDIIQAAFSASPLTTD